MNPIFLHNSLTNKKEKFSPAKRTLGKKVSMYHCGPTVYDYAHIGNLRSYVFSDMLRRTFEYNGYKVKQVINITDVGHLVTDSDDGEDKMTKALKRENKPLTLASMHEIATKYSDAFVSDLKDLNIELPYAMPRASDHIKEDIELIQKLFKKGIAYKTSDGVYFDIAKFPSYGELGNIKATMQTSIEGGERMGRIETNPEKHNAADFALWKFDSKVGWDSPFGKGFPGWHIECSAMAREFLGQPFDIHTGGIDHIPVHHNNEIAQSEAAYGKPLAKYWLHNGHILVNGEKIAKSAGNGIILADLKEKLASPIAYRYWLLTSHYRTQANFSYEAAMAAQTALFKLCEEIITWMGDVGEVKKFGKPNKKYQAEFLANINDDLNTAAAIAVLWTVVRDASLPPVEKLATILDFDKVLGLHLSELAPVPVREVPPEVVALADAREEARKAKDFVQADALRAEIESRGFTVKDTAGGPKIEEI